MEGLETWQLLTIALLFVWSGFVRSALSFGGAVLTLPFPLMVDNAPLVLLPIIAIHLLFFSFITVAQSRHRQASAGAAGSVNWQFLRYTLLLMIVPKLIVVMGVITLPANIVSSFIFVVVEVYAVSYILDKPIKSNNKGLDAFFMFLGGYVSGTPAVSEKRLTLTSNGNIRYQLKTPYRDGTTHFIFERGGPPPLDFIAKLAALVPKPRTNLTHFHGVFARGGLPPNSKFRVRVTPAKRGSGRKRRQPTGVLGVLVGVLGSGRELRTKTVCFRSMARPLRLEFPNALYHVASRGDRREDIYDDDDDERNSWKS